MTNSPLSLTFLLTSAACRRENVRLSGDLGKFGHGVE